MDDLAAMMAKQRHEAAAKAARLEVMRARVASEMEQTMETGLRVNPLLAEAYGIGVRPGIQPTARSTPAVQRQAASPDSDISETSPSSSRRIARQPLRQLGMLDLVALDGNQACNRQGVHAARCRSDGESAALTWALQREEAVPCRNDGDAEGVDDYDSHAEGMRGGVLLHGRGWRAEEVITALIATDGPHAAPADAHKSGGGAAAPRLRTLVVCAASRVEEIERLLSGAQLPYVRFEGSVSKRRTAVASGCAVVLATYGMIVAKDVVPPSDAPGLPGWRMRHGAAPRDGQTRRSLLHVPTWHRLVLLDAQAVTNVSTQRAQAALALRAHCRWAVTGPPTGAARGRKPKEHDQVALLTLIGMDPGAARGRKAGGLVREERGVASLLTARRCSTMQCDDEDEDGSAEDGHSDDERSAAVPGRPVQRVSKCQENLRVPHTDQSEGEDTDEVSSDACGEV